MAFRILALDPKNFSEYFAKSDDELSALGARRVIADADFGYPCRISLEDAKCGETLILLNFRHLPQTTPYQSSHAIFVKENATQAQLRAGEIPASILKRLLSVRAFDAHHMMTDADVIDGTQLAEKLEEYLSHPNVDYIHIHNAKRGCFAAQAVRA